MLNIVKWIVSFVKLSFYAHHGQFDVIRPVNGYDIEQVRKCWFISLVFFILVVLYGVIGLECESRPSCTIDWTTLPSSQYNFYHQMFPSALGNEVNMMSLSVLLLCIGSWIGFLSNPQIERRYLIFVDDMGKGNNDALEQMCNFRDRFIKFALSIEIVIFIFGFTFVSVHVFSIIANYNVNWTSMLFWCLFNPMHLYLCDVFLYTTPLYVILASRYMTIQQKSLTRKLIDLNVKLRSIRLYPELAKRRSIHHRLWLQYLQVNMQICDLCRHVREYARYWSPYLTMLFASLISFQCCVFYMCVFAPGLSSVLRFLLLLCVFGVVFTELVLITQCAAVVKSFKRITGHNRAFHQSYTNEAGVGKVLARNLLKAENLQDSRLLHSYAFRLFGNYRITTKSFHIIISYISIFFLFITKNKY